MPSIIFEDKFDKWWSCIVCESVLAIKIIDMFYNLLSHLLAIFPTVFPLQFTSLIGIEGIWNFTGADAGNPKFHHIKTILCKTVSKTLLQITAFRISHHSNLSHSVFFSVDLFFRRKRHMKFCGCSTRNPKFHHVKNFTCKTVSNTPFQITDHYQSMSSLLNQSPLSNLSHSVFFSVDLFLRHRRHMKFCGCRCWKP